MVRQPLWKGSMKKFKQLKTELRLRVLKEKRAGAAEVSVNIMLALKLIDEIKKLEKESFKWKMKFLNEETRL